MLLQQQLLWKHYKNKMCFIVLYCIFSAPPLIFWPCAHGCCPTERCSPSVRWREALRSRFSFRISLCTAVFVFPSILTSLLVPADEKHPYCMIAATIFIHSWEGDEWGLVFSKYDLSYSILVLSDCKMLSLVTWEAGTVADWFKQVPHTLEGVGSCPGFSLPVWTLHGLPVVALLQPLSFPPMFQKHSISWRQQCRWKGVNVIMKVFVFAYICSAIYLCPIWVFPHPKPAGLQHT